MDQSAKRTFDERGVLAAIRKTRMYADATPDERRLLEVYLRELSDDIRSDLPSLRPDRRVVG